jgi:Glycosyl hydrolase family 76
MGAVMESASAAQRELAERAGATYDAMLHQFGVADGAGLFRETSAPVPERIYAYLWPFTWALVATLDLAGLPAALQGGRRLDQAITDRLAGLGRYWDGHHTAYASYVVPPLGPGGDRYFDDNAWVGLALVQLHRLRGPGTIDDGSGPLRRLRQFLRPSEPTPAVDRARVVHEWALRGWGSADRGPISGGLPWVDAPWNRDRGSGATAGHAQLGVQLAELTGDETLIGSAEATGALRLYAWVEANLRDPADGLYWDKFLGDGSIDRTKWSYNQAVMLGVSALLYRATGEQRYRQRGQEIAGAVLDRMDLTRQPASFNCMLCRNLLLLASVLDDERVAEAYPTALRAYAEWAWNTIRDPSTTLFPFDGPTAPVTLLDQAAMVQINALLAWDPSDWPKLA